MATELALQAYVFMGNALNFIVNGAGAPERSAVGASPEELQELYGKVEPLTPKNILDEVRRLTRRERGLLLRVCVVCAERLGEEAEAIGGISADEAARVVGWLEQDLTAE